MPEKARRNKNLARNHDFFFSVFQERILRLLGFERASCMKASCMKASCMLKGKKITGNVKMGGKT